MLHLLTGLVVFAALLSQGRNRLPGAARGKKFFGEMLDAVNEPLIH